MSMIHNFPNQINGAVHNRDNPHSVFRPKGSDAWLMEYVAWGAARLQLGGRTLDIGPGDLILYRPGVRQDYRMKDGWEHHWASFFPRAHWNEWLRWPEWESGLYHLHIQDEEFRKKLLDLFREGAEISSQAWPQIDNFILNQVERILLWINTINPLSRHALLDSRIRHALQYLVNHHADPITLSLLADHSNMSESRFSHLFRKEMGQPPMQMLNRYRIERGQDLLRMSSLPIGEIARRVGFPNPLYFTRLFKQQVGMSPRQFRKQDRPEA
ncbi:MAG: helix-turn-helix domain-containing protein [Planctomycetota bacterium]|jgi:AraC family transcriptional regulator of arabinose operon